MAFVIFAMSPGFGAAQDTEPPAAGATCWHAGPAPGCRLSILTEVGGYVKLGGSSHARLGATVDWGVLFNQGTHNAFGLALSVWLPDDYNVGPSLRYRRWFQGGRSLDLAIGTPVWGDADTGSILGLVRVNVTPSVAVGARLHHLRFDHGPDVGDTDDPGVFRGLETDDTRIFLGLEVGGDVGRWVSLIGLPVLGFLRLIGVD